MATAGQGSDGGDEAPLTVGELLGLVAGTFEAEYAQLLVTGELSSFKRAASGHLYFTLTDGDACLDAVMWRQDAFRLAFQPRQGDEVLLRGRMGVYAQGGRMQLYVAAMKPVGAGAAQKALEELKRRLAAEGLFAAERKRALPLLPAIPLGVWLGKRLHDRLDEQRLYFWCYVLVGAAGAKLLADSLRQMLVA